jgi:hypothetical protein
MISLGFIDRKLAFEGTELVLFGGADKSQQEIRLSIAAASARPAVSPVDTSSAAGSQTPTGMGGLRGLTSQLTLRGRCG